ncbi:MAG: hypothetical protein EOO04_30760 [Chitinophagaceae bacterium]|nr:MAG: hypothetical protein EOO04_30760 [Chitinophagaceae bacterium]
MKSVGIPLVLTFAMDPDSKERLDLWRQIHFPPERNHLSSHLTIYHQLPGQEITRIDAMLKEFAQTHQSLTINFTELKTRQGFVGISVVSPTMLETKAELDALLFVRNAQPPSSLIPDVQGFDPEFSTAGDYVFARFIANERTQEFLTNCLYGPEETETLSGMTKRRVTLKWTGDAINLAEMAYGIWLTGQVNHGNAGIAEIMGWLEVNFQVNIGRPFRRWQSISSRKRVSQVKYLDQMKAAILKRLDDENA